MRQEKETVSTTKKKKRSAALAIGLHAYRHLNSPLLKAFVQSFASLYLFFFGEELVPRKSI